MPLGYGVRAGLLNTSLQVTTASGLAMVTAMCHSRPSSLYRVIEK
jgi:hypothetical protein